MLMSEKTPLFRAFSLIFLLTTVKVRVFSPVYKNQQECLPLNAVDRRMNSVVQFCQSR